MRWISLAGMLFASLALSGCAFVLMHRQVKSDLQEQFPSADLGDSTFTYAFGNCYVMAIRLTPIDSERLRNLPNWIDPDEAIGEDANRLAVIYEGARQCGAKRMINADISAVGPVLLMFVPNRSTTAWLLLDLPAGAGELAPGDYLFQVAGPD